jgi:hypothetical protein
LKIAKERAVSSANKLSNSIQEKQKIFVIDLHKEDLDNVYAKKQSRGTKKEFRNEKEKKTRIKKRF